MKKLPIAIIGGGPVGLAAAAQLLERGEPTVVLEAGDSVGANVRRWAHVCMFSPWEFNVDAACRRLLEAAGWTMPPAAALPTGAELLAQYLQPLAALPALRAVIRYGARVQAISRRGQDKLKDSGREDAPFVLRLLTSAGAETTFEARAVIDASGTWQRQNPLGADGLPALGERALGARIRYGIPDVLGRERERYAGARVIVVGSGHSAINALLDLLNLRRQVGAGAIVWAMRSDNLRKVYGGGDADALPARGQLGSRIRAAVEAGALEIAAPFAINRVEADSSQVLLHSAERSLPADEIIACTGSRPELSLLSELRLDLDPAVESSRALAPLIDPNLHSCGTVRPHGEAELRQPEKDFYIIGMKSYGRAPTFLLATGYEQARSVTAALCGDWAAARAVELNLPETGVCVTDYAADADDCCAPLPAAPLISPLDIPLGAELARANGGGRSCC